MHSYLRAIGFSKIKTKKEQNLIIASAIANANKRTDISTGANTTIVQLNQDYGKGIGLAIIGEYDDNDYFDVEHFFPYCIGDSTTHQTDIQIEKHSDKESYSAISDDYSLGITLIYNMINVVDYIRSTWSNNYYHAPTEVAFGALSINGRVLCGVHLDYLAYPYDKQPISNKERRNLVAKAKSGDIDALESLTLDDMDTYTLISKRIKEEDLFSVVETYFIPYGIDNEQYSILGIIKNVEEVTNELSGEMVYNLSILCNDVRFNVAINSCDLQGEPLVGRRFKGIIWLHGMVHFTS